jgi:hypothetical protein
MRLIEWSQRQLARDTANSPKVAALFLIAAGGWLALDQLGVEDLASPWLATPLLPLALIYTAERLEKLQWFRGMSLPSLFVLAASTALVWTLNARPPVPSMFAYAAVAGLVAAWGFLIFRMWTFGPGDRKPQ